MNLSSLLDWHWQQSMSEVEPQAAVGFGIIAPQLLACLRQMPSEHQARLHVTANRDVLIVTGKTALLPWIDGIEYAAPDACAPSLWLPTRWQPSLPTELIAQALKQRYLRVPYLLWHQPKVIIPLDKQLPVSPALLDRIEKYWEET